MNLISSWRSVPIGARIWDMSATLPGVSLHWGRGWHGARVSDSAKAEGAEHGSTSPWPGGATRLVLNV